MKKFYDVVNNIKPEDRNKILAILEAEYNHINNTKDILKYIENLDKFFLDLASLSLEEYAKNVIYVGELYMEDVFPYIDLETLRKDLVENRNAKLTDYGVLCRMDEEIENSHEEAELE